MLRLCSYYTFAREDCTKPREPLATHKPFMSVFQTLESPSHAGAMDKYNSVEGLLAPAREGALRPLSGRYLLKLAAGQRSLMWSPLPFRFSIPPVSLGLLWVQVCHVLLFDLSRLSPLKSGGGKLQRRQDLPEEAFFSTSGGGRAG